MGSLFNELDPFLKELLKMCRVLDATFRGSTKIKGVSQNLFLCYVTLHDKISLCVLIVKPLLNLKSPFQQHGFSISLPLCSGLLWWLSDKEPACQCRRCRFDPWSRKILWRRKWQPTPVFLPGKSQEQKSLEGYSPWSHKELDIT